MSADADGSRHGGAAARSSGGSGEQGLAGTAEQSKDRLDSTGSLP